jgi:hypothetical protein
MKFAAARRIGFRRSLMVVAMASCLIPRMAFACSACFGKSDSKLAEGMNWGIFTLLGVVVAVLGGAATFMVYLAKKSAAMNGRNSVSIPVQTTEKA